LPFLSKGKISKGYGGSFQSQILDGGLGDNIRLIQLEKSLKKTGGF